MHMFMVGLLAGTALGNASFVEPSQDAMREAFATDLADGVRAVLAYMGETGGSEAVTRIRGAGTDSFAITGFRKGECRRSLDGHVCGFAVEIDTVSGSIARSMEGRFFVGACGLTYDRAA
jgi:hypothetical protein